MKNYFVKSILTMVLLTFMVVFTGCSSAPTTAKAPKVEPGTVLKISEKEYQFQVTVPNGWQEATKTFKKNNEDVTFGAFSKEKYFMVIYDDISDFDEDFNLKKYADIITEDYKETVKRAEITFVKDFKIGNYDAKQYTIKGSIDNMKIKYLLTFVKTEKHYSQLTCWSSESGYDEAAPEFESIVTSFAKISQ